MAGLSGDWLRSPVTARTRAQMWARAPGSTSSRGRTSPLTVADDAEIARSRCRWCHSEDATTRGSAWADCRPPFPAQRVPMSLIANGTAQSLRCHAVSLFDDRLVAAVARFRCCGRRTRPTLIQPSFVRVRYCDIGNSTDMYVEQSAAFEASFNSGITGLTGTVSVKVVNNDGVDVIGPTTANIAEDGVSGVYIWNAPAAPATLGQYTIIWSSDGAYDPESVGTDDLVVVSASAGVLPPIPAPEGGGASVGPCTAWITGDDVIACCSVESSSGFEFDDVADQASQLLFELSGRLFPGECGPKTVRPPCHGCHCGYQVLSRGYVVGSWIWDGASTRASATTARSPALPPG